MIQSSTFTRYTENLIANFRSLPENKSRSILRKEKDVSVLIDKLMDRFSINQNSPETTIILFWPRIVGKKHADKCQPKKILSNSKLVINVSSAPLRAYLMMDSQRILKCVQDLQGCHKIHSLIWR